MLVWMSVSAYKWFTANQILWYLCSNAVIMTVKYAVVISGDIQHLDRILNQIVQNGWIFGQLELESDIWYILSKTFMEHLWGACDLPKFGVDQFTQLWEQSKTKLPKMGGENSFSQLRRLCWSLLCGCVVGPRMSNWQCQSNEVDFTLIYTMFISWQFFLCLHLVVVKWTSLTCLVSALSYILVIERSRPLKTDCISSLKSVTIYRFCHSVM